MVIMEHRWWISKSVLGHGREVDDADGILHGDVVGVDALEELDELFLGAKLRVLLLHLARGVIVVEVEPRLAHRHHVRVLADPPQLREVGLAGPRGVVRPIVDCKMPLAAAAAAHARMAANDSLQGRSPGKQPSDTASVKARGTRELQDDTLAFTPSDSIVTGRAGLNRFLSVMTQGELSVPRTRGAEPSLRSDGLSVIGCSPHARG